MSTETYILGKTYLLPVTEVIHENRRSFYKVLANGQEHSILLFPFQRDDERPSQISCLVKDIRDGEPVFVQDTQPLLMRLYHEGETYPFWVKQDRTQFSIPYYEISDWNSFTFKLPAAKGEKLHIRQRIECRVDRIQDGRIYLSMIQKEKRTYSLPFLTLEALLAELEIHPLMASLIAGIFRKDRLFKPAREAYMSENEEWVVTVIDELDRQMEKWVSHNGRPNRYLLETFRRTCIYLLEDSDTLVNCSDQERSRYQEILSRSAEDADIFLEAIGLMQNRRHTQMTDITLSKMRRSGYLFNPGRRLKVLMSLLSLDKGLMEAKMNIIFQIIIEGNHTNWMREPFRSAFIGMLDLFVLQSRAKVDSLAEIRSDRDRQDLEKLVSALAIQLLLMNEKDNYDRQLRRAMLYRYLTYIKGSNRDNLLEKAFRCLTDAEQSRLEFQWDQLTDLTLLAIRTSSILPAPQRRAGFMQTFNGNESRIQLVDGNIEVRPVRPDSNEVAVLPDGMFPWNHIQVFLNTSISPLPNGKADLKDWQKFWKEVECAATCPDDTVQHVSRKRKMRPDPGETVCIRVLQQDVEQPDRFICRIEDPVYEGTGFLYIRDIVRYNILVDESAFRDDENRPCLFNAVVQNGEHEGEIRFVMFDLLNEFVRDCIHSGQETVCIVTDNSVGYLLCVSMDGYSVYVPKTAATENTARGEYVKVEIDGTRPSGIVSGTYLQTVQGDFTSRVAFENLMFSYADGSYEAPVTEKEVIQQEAMMDESYVKEIICIIDRLAVLSTDYTVTFNYLYFARILSLIAGDKEAGMYYNERMHFLLMLHHFGVNGSIGIHQVESLSDDNGLAIGNYPILQSRFHELQLIAAMDHPAENDRIWELMHSTSEDHLKRLARLVLAYNSLKGFDLYREREAIRRRICEELDLKMEEDTSTYFGREDLHHEFKTSVVYPSSNGMREDIVKQTHHILKVVCGFLNAEGGTLYVGVNDEGVASGLDNDLEFFGSMDKLDLHVRTQIARQLGLDANAHIHTAYPDANGKAVYALQIRPSSNPVELEGICYQRQGTSTWPLFEDNLTRFRERRAEEVKRLQDSAAAEEACQEAGAIDFPTGLETAPNPVQQEETTAAPEPLKVKDDMSTISTSLIRENPTHDWEDNYLVGTVCFLHFLPNGEYRVTSECTWEPVKLSLAIRENEEFVILVYENGNAVRVPVSQLLDKMNKGVYKTHAARILFACPVHRTDLLMTESRKYDGSTYVRIDEVTLVKEGKITDGGERLSTVDYEGAADCEILSAGHAAHLKKLMGLRDTHIGHCRNNTWCREEMEYLNKVRSNTNG